jgi:hypothetical protein
MNKLNLPVIENCPSTPRVMTMEEYIDFCDFNREHCFDADAYTWWKKKSIVTERFVLHDDTPRADTANPE